MKNIHRILLLSLFIFLSSNLFSQKMEWISSTEGNVWKKDKVSLVTKQIELLTWNLAMMILSQYSKLGE